MASSFNSEEVKNYDDDDGDGDGDDSDSDNSALRKKLHLLFQGEKAFMGRRAGRLQWWTGHC